MKIVIIILILTVFFLNLEVSSAEENEYGIVKAWFNDKNATLETIKDIKLKIGEPVEVKIEVISKINGNVYIELNEPGVTKAFNVLSGPSKQDEMIDNLKIISGWSKNYTWKLAPNGAWKNGNAPINIFVEFSKIKNDKKMQFTIANPYILDEQYSGAASTPVQTQKAAEPEPGATAQAKSAPFPPALLAIAMLLIAWHWRRKA